MKKPRWKRGSSFSNILINPVSFRRLKCLLTESAFHCHFMAWCRESQYPMSELNTSLFAQVKGVVLFNATLSDGAYRFFCLVLYLSGQNDHCWYTQLELAKFMGRTGKHADRAVRKYQKECVEAGIMRVEQPGYHKANKYYPLVKVIPQKREVIHDETPPAEGRTPTPPKGRTLPHGKSHAPNNIQHGSASSTLYKPIPPKINWSNYNGNGKYARLVAAGGS